MLVLAHIFLDRSLVITRVIIGVSIAIVTILEGTTLEQQVWDCILQLSGGTKLHLQINQYQYWKCIAQSH